MVKEGISTVGKLDFCTGEYRMRTETRIGFLDTRRGGAVGIAMAKRLLAER